MMTDTKDTTFLPFFKRIFPLVQACADGILAKGALGEKIVRQVPEQGQISCQK
jgi:hypothetical protein